MGDIDEEINKLPFAIFSEQKNKSIDILPKTRCYSEYKLKKNRIKDEKHKKLTLIKIRRKKIFLLK